MSMQLIVVAPGLLAQPAPLLAASASLALLARYASPPRLEPQGLATAFLQALGAPVDTPVAPLAALGAGVAVDGDYVTAADPVYLAVDRDDVVLMQRVDDLAPDDARTLVSMLERHFEADGVQFMLPRQDAWFARCTQTPDITTTPFDAAHGHGLYPYLPRGGDAGTWKRWQNEIQLLLHEHPVNAVREAQGKVPVNGVWFWGGGHLADIGAWAKAATSITAPSGRMGDLARGIARHGGITVTAPDVNDSASTIVERMGPRVAGNRPPRVAVVMLDTIDGNAALSALGTRWLAPALTLLSRRRIDALDVLADGNGNAARWTAQPPALWRRMIAGTHAKPFAALATEAGDYNGDGTTDENDVYAWCADNGQKPGGK